MRDIYIIFFISSMIFSSSGFSIKEKIFVLDPGIEVLPGHNDLSTVEQEKNDNPFVGINSTIDLSTLQ